MRRFLLATTLLLAALPVSGQDPTPTDSALRVAGQTPRPATDSLFRRARRLVAEGRGAAGRALVDSLLRTADPVTPAHGDALYWHGALAPTAAEAERDYRRVIVEYPLAYYAPDALLAIAELEQARGDRPAALLHLQRFVKEHPSNPGRGIAALGAARLAFEQRDPKLGCSMIAIARTSVPTADVELRNQVNLHGRQCAGASIVSSAPPAVARPAAAPARTVAATPPQRPAPLPSTPPGSSAPARPSPRETTTVTLPVTSTMPAPADPMPRAAAAPSTGPRQPARRDSTVARPAAAPPSAPLGQSMYTIQLAAYDTRPPAEELVRKLATRNVKARVSGTARPFRVRLDFYRTRQEAATVVAALKARGIVGFVAEEVPPAGVAVP